MALPLVDLKAQYLRIKPEIDAALQRVIDNTSFILGKEVATFERHFAASCGAEGAVGVASGTAAIHLALSALGIGPGDEVVSPAHTFTACAEPIVLLGARPVFADIDPENFNLSPERVREAITPRTRAILAVHLYGQPADMDALRELAHEHGIPLVEDAAQAHGARWGEERCGSLSQIACFSFYPGKNLGAYGDGGMVTTSDPELLEKVRRLRDHGRVSKYVHEEIGWGERLDALQAAVLDVKLRHLPTWTEERRDRAARYRERLAHLPLTLPVERPPARHCYHLFVVRCRRRDELLAHLRERGIGAGIHYPVPLHRQPAYRALGLGDAQLPETERAAAEVLSLPLFPELTDEQIERVAEAAEEFFAA